MDCNLGFEDWGNNNNQAKYSIFNWYESRSLGYEVRKREVCIVTLFII